MESIDHCMFKQYNAKLKTDVFCKFPICKNENNLHYCGNHLPLGEIGPNGKMTECKLCKQSIGENILERHLKKCNVILSKKNSVISNDNIITPRIWKKREKKISDIPELKIKDLKRIVNEIYEKLNIEITESIKYDEDLLGMFSKEEWKGKNKKDWLQEISMFTNLKNENIININMKTLIVELGCGDGSWSRTFQKGFKYYSNHLLVDRMKYKSRNKYDNVLLSEADKAKTHAKIVRELIDIKDWHIEPHWNDEIDNVWYVFKHLCGDACEWAFHKIVSKNTKDIQFGFTTCCHYLLDSSTYCNMKFVNSLGISNQDFDAWCLWTSWSTLKDQDCENAHFGTKIKRVIDYGRCWYLRECKCEDVKMMIYTKETKENMWIIGKWDKEG